MSDYKGFDTSINANPFWRKFQESDLVFSDDAGAALALFAIANEIGKLTGAVEDATKEIKHVHETIFRKKIA